MGFFDWFKRERNVPKPEEPDPTTVATGYLPNSLQFLGRNNALVRVAEALTAQNETARLQRYADADEMDFGDISTMLDVVVDSLLSFEDISRGRGFRIAANNRQVQALLETAAQKAQIVAVLEECLRDMFKYGDCFLEPVFSNTQLVHIQTYVPKEIVIHKDSKGRFFTGKDDNGYYLAYQQKIDDQVVAGWRPFELIHGKLYASSRSSYSTRSLLDPIRKDWRKLQLAELGMVTARLTRAYPRDHHYIDLTGKDSRQQEETLSRYVARVFRGKKKDKNTGLPDLDVSEDLFIATGYTQGNDGQMLPKLTQIKTVDPTIAGLAELGDIRYLQSKVWSYVPSDTAGIPRTANLEGQDIAFSRLLIRAQVQAIGLLRALFDQVLLASGRLPSTPEFAYEIILPASETRANWKYADAEFRYSLTLRNYLEVGAMSRRTLMKRAFNLSDEEIDNIFAEIEAEREQFPEPDTGTDLARGLAGNNSGGDV